jgi:hypothetical protein
MSLRSASSENDKLLNWASWANDIGLYLGEHLTLQLAHELSQMEKNKMSRES